jgi:hypothetical protein
VTLRQAVVATAQRYVGVRELSHNSGPEIDRWLAGVGERPGAAWCAAYAFGVFEEASADCAMPNPCPRVAGALRMLADCPGVLCPLPAPGDLMFIDHGGGLGHVCIVETVSPDGNVVTEISGNTYDDATGSREGDRVARHTWDVRGGRAHGGRIVGFVDLCSDGAPAAA